MDASAHNEQIRVLQKMKEIYQAYTTGPTTDDPTNESHCFSTVLYNPANQQQRQFQAAMQSTTFRQEALTLVQPKPPQISERDWRLYCVRNPDPTRFVPIAVVGAANLAARTLQHQQQSEQHQRECRQVAEAVETLRERAAATRLRLEALGRVHARQRQRLLRVVKHSEVARCLRAPLQSAELEALRRVRHLQRAEVEARIAPAVVALADGSAAAASSASVADHRQLSREELPSEEVQRQWIAALKDHRSKLTAMTEEVEKDQRDLQLIRDRVVAPASPQRRLGV